MVGVSGGDLATGLRMLKALFAAVAAWAAATWASAAAALPLVAGCGFGGAEPAAELPAAARCGVRRLPDDSAGTAATARALATPCPPAYVAAPRRVHKGMSDPACTAPAYGSTLSGRVATGPGMQVTHNALTATRCT